MRERICLLPMNNNITLTCNCSIQTNLQHPATALGRDAFVKLGFVYWRILVLISFEGGHNNDS
jgi:hypothetical protein